MSFVLFPLRRLAERFRSAEHFLLRGPLVAAVAFMACFSPSDLQAGNLRRSSAAASTTAGDAAAVGSNTDVAAAQAQAIMQRSQQNLRRSNQSVQSVQALQSAARAAAVAAASTIPDGLQVGGLQVNPNVASNAALWSGANLPTSTSADGKTTVTIAQKAQFAVLNWQTFNVSKNTTVNFDQSLGGNDVGTWVAFNKITDPSGVPSQIRGAINAAGQVYIINQNGVIFGGSAQVNTHTMVASSLPINNNLIARGLLNNPDEQFLFSQLTVPAGSNGPTSAFIPTAPLTTSGRAGDVLVEAGAILSAPSNADRVGGRVALVGANVSNQGAILTPDGQTILAAGLQVGMTAHNPDDPSQRILDVAVGAVADPSTPLVTYAGTATNEGLIDAPRGNVTVVGKNVQQSGAITSSTSVSLNGSINLLAEYDSESRAGRAGTSAFLPKSTGLATLGSSSVIQIATDISAGTNFGTQLALPSQVTIRGGNVHFDTNSVVLAPNATVKIDAGSWTVTENSALRLNGLFLNDRGQIYLDKNALIDVSGSANVDASVADNIVTVELLGAELANSPLQRNGALYREKVQVDIRQTGTFNGVGWVGTPLADASGYVNSIKRSVGQLTVNGGTVSLGAGNSVVMQEGSSINVSGGYTNYQGAFVQTSKVLQGNRVLDIAQATPDLVYSGLYEGEKGGNISKRWGISDPVFNTTFNNGTAFEAGYIQGGNGGAVSISAPALALDGSLLGTTVAGPRQTTPMATIVANFSANNALPTIKSNLAVPTASALSLSIAAPLSGPVPVGPTITFKSNRDLPAVAAFTIDAAGTAAALSTDRQQAVELTSDLFGQSGFGVVSVDNSAGHIVVNAGVSLDFAAGGSVQLAADNLSIFGAVNAPGGTINLAAFNVPTASPLYATVGAVTPAPTPGSGNFVLGSAASLSTAGSLISDQQGSIGVARYLNGGTISINSYNAVLQDGGKIDVSGGVSVSNVGKFTHGNGGALTLNVGRDPKLTSVVGGQLSMGAGFYSGTGFLGYSGGKGGSLSLQAPRFQVGGSSSDSSVTLFAPEFFNQGGFTSFSLRGLGLTSPTEGGYLPGMVITEGTQITPVARQRFATTQGGAISLNTSIDPQSIPQASRSPVSLSFAATGVSDFFDGVLATRGELKMGAGAVIKTDPKATVTLSGQTVNMQGAIYAPAGTINITGASNSNSLLFVNSSVPIGAEALPTVEIGANAVLSATGATLALFNANPRGNQTGSFVPGGPVTKGYLMGEVLPGGTINVSGNVVAKQGAVFDVSGATAILDKVPSAITGLASQSFGGDFQSVRQDSSGGTINLTGRQALMSAATLIGSAGGSSAQGGSLVIGSNRFTPLNSTTTLTPLDVTLTVTQSTAPFSVASNQAVIGEQVKNSLGQVLFGQGYVAVDTFAAGGFDRVTLAGTTNFTGDVSVSAKQSLTVATSGVMYANGQVNLTAPSISIGTPFSAPVTAQNVISPFTATAVYGAGQLSANASLVDIGNLSLQGIGAANLVATAGDIRGNGTFNIAGDLILKANQVYPTTGSAFTVSAFDYTAGGTRKTGSVTIQADGVSALPYSAGGQLNVYASSINQNGVLRAPLGGINLGWNGSGVAPINLLTGAAMGATKQLTLSSGSVTSVSAIDPLTGNGVTIPFGINQSGATWINPAGQDITLGGVPAKSIQLGALNLVDAEGSQVDIRGGGDLSAYRFVTGKGGTVDVLATNGSFAVMPSYGAAFAPYAAYNSAAALGGDQGYVNSALAVGDRIYLEKTPSLAAGYYTLLPARYALLPGAFLVTPKSGSASSAVAMPDGSSVVAGYRSNGLSKSQVTPTLYSSFEVASSAVVQQRAQYDSFSANVFLKKSAVDNSVAVARLPVDSGKLVFASPASGTMVIGGAVLSRPLDAGLGRGGLVDISSPLDIIIGGVGTAAVPGSLVLSAKSLSSFGADSLLIGGVRDATGTKVSVTTGNLRVDTAASNEVLKGSDIILVANKTLVIAAGASVSESSSATSTFESLSVGSADSAGSGDGVLFRATGDLGATVSRYGVGSGTVATLTVGSGANISGANLTFDSSFGTVVNPTALLAGKSVALNSGRISLVLDSSNPISTGLVLSGSSLANLQATANALSLLSYSTIDVYGAGTIGSSSFSNLALHTAQVRGFAQAGGLVDFKAKNVLLDNSPGITAVGSASGSTGSISFSADSLTLGTNALSISQFASVNLSASRDIKVQGTGGLNTQGDLTITTPLLTSKSSASYDINSTGSLVVAEAGPSSGTAVAGLGSRLSFTGSTINAQSNITLPSGNVSLRATAGDVIVSGSIDTGGTLKDYFGSTKFTNAGRINLIADVGSVYLLGTGKLDVSAEAAGGDAGSVSISASKGDFVFAGEVAGQAGLAGHSGTFSLDVGSLADLTAVDTKLNSDSFNESRAYRIRTGDVLVGGSAISRNYRLSVDQGNLTFRGRIDASGTTGGAVSLSAGRAITLTSGSTITVAGKDFDAAGKGGTINLETRGQSGAVIDVQSGAKLDLSVAAKTAGSAALGDYSGVLHLRAPQTTSQTDLLLNTFNGQVTGASQIIVEGFANFVPSGGLIDTVKAAISANGTKFTQNTGDLATSGTMINRLFVNNVSLIPLVSVEPGAEIVNSNATLTPVLVSLNTAGSSSLVVAAGVPITFTTGTVGTNKIRSTTAGNFTTTAGVVTAFAANAAVTVPAGAVVKLTSSGTVSFASGGTGGAIPVVLPTMASFTTAGSTTVTPTGAGSAVQLNTSGTSSLGVVSGTVLSLPGGTQGNNKLTSSVPGIITSASGVTSTLAANVATAIAPGSTLSFASTGTLTFAAGGTGGAITVSLPQSGAFTLNNAATILTPTNDLTLLSTFDLSGFRFGTSQVPGVLTLRAAGNLVFNTGASLSDGFAPASASATDLWQAPLMAAGSRSWSYRLVSGADFSAADYRSLSSLSSLAANSGSLLLGKGFSDLPTAITGATSASIIPTRYQVIRTGTGDIDIVAGRDVQLLNSLATIYTAGTQASAMANFDLPVLNLVGNNSNGVFEAPASKAQYSLGGGSVVIEAQNDIAHYLASSTGSLLADSSKQMPTNWLYRRGAVNSAGEFATSGGGDIASTTWWVDYSNFFQGVGALGGGNVSLLAGGSVVNVDAVAPTNARMPYQSSVNTGGGVVVDKLAANQVLQELGGGNVSVAAGRNIDAGVYYVESGKGVLTAGNSITTNRTRAALNQATLTNSAFASAPPDSSTLLGTTLFVGKSSFAVSAGGGLLLGAVANPFLLPQAINNRGYQRSYFSTYDAASAVDVTSLSGSVTLRDNPFSGDGFGSGSLISWYLNVLYPSTNINTASLSASQPWLKTVERSTTNIAAMKPFQTVAALMPGTLRVTAFTGDINVVGGLLLSPSSKGTLELGANGSINGFNGTRLTNPTRPFDASTNTYSFNSAMINLSDADPAGIPSANTPLASTLINTPANLMDSINALFDESGSFAGSRGVLQTKQSLHASTPLHVSDFSPLQVYALKGDISGVTLFSGKASEVVAGNDITDIALYIQNVRPTDISLVQAGRDIVAYKPNSLLRQNATLVVNKAANNVLPSALAGDIQISGPGTLAVFTGRNLDLGGGKNNLDGTGAGITSIGNARNPALPFGGANIIAAAGWAAPSADESSQVDFAAFIKFFLNPATPKSVLADFEAGFLDAKTDADDFRARLLAEPAGAARYLPLLGELMGLIGSDTGQVWAAFGAKSPGEQQRLALQVFSRVLRDAGRDYSNSAQAGFGTYAAGYAAISALFPNGVRTDGDIKTDSRIIKTTNGGYVTLLAPGGGLSLGANSAGNKDASQGILTEYGGDISIFTRDNVDVGKSRIFTLRGGNEVIWSSKGNIAAGISAKTVQSAPPTRVLIDPQSGDVKTDLAGLATGGGIGVLASVAGVTPGDVDLIAPEGAIDAGDAGIRSSGNLNIAALTVLNASNISSGGTTTGAPAALAPAVIVATATPSPDTGSKSAAEVAAQTAQASNRGNEMPSFLNIDVIGYGGGESDLEKEKADGGV